VYFDKLAAHLENDPAKIKIAANYLVNDIGEASPPSVSAFAELVHLISDNKLSSRGAKDVLALLLSEGSESAVAIAEREGLIQDSDPEALRAVVKSVLVEHAGVVEEYRSGKESVLQFLIGQGMKASKGAGNPAVMREIMLEELTQS
jgi:aspartyl-tRNA(Asn)/glutamyl-tRNA(Gln) amidotransferase subunit B